VEVRVNCFVHKYFFLVSEHAATDRLLPSEGSIGATPERNHISHQLTETGVLFRRLIGPAVLYSVRRLSLPSGSG
jgi:hypothetical protein